MLLPVALRAQITTFPWSDDFSDSAASMNTWTISPAGSFDVMTAVGNMAEGSMVSLGVSGTMTSPAFTLPANANGYKMTYYVYGELPYLEQGAVGYYFVTVNTTTTTDTVDTYYCYTNGFERVSIDLEEYAGQTITVSFEHAANYSILAIDDFKIGPTSAPLYYVSGASVAQLNTPYTYVANHVEGDTANNAMSFSWTSRIGTITGTGDTITVSYAAAGLDTIRMIAQNTYGRDTVYFPVEAISCPGISAFPYEESFEEATANCWTAIDKNGAAIDNFYISNNEEYAHTGTHCIGSRYNENAAPDEMMVSPAITMPANTTGMQLYWYVRGGAYGEALGRYEVLVSTTGNSVNDFTDTIFRQEFTAQDAEALGYVQHSASIANYTGTIYIAFRANCDVDANTLFIDDVKIRAALEPVFAIEGPASVERPETATFTATYVEGDQTGMSYNWTSTLGTVTGANTLSATVSYNANGTDTVIFTAQNSHGDFTDSIFVNVYTCDAISQFPYEEGFENGVLGCWTAISNNTENEAKMGVFEMSGAYEGDHLFTFSSLDGDEDTTDFNQYLISPELNLSEGTTYHFKFQYVGTSSYGTESFTVLTSSTDKQISSFTNEIGYNDEVEAGAWEEFDAVIPAGTKYIAINYNSIWQYRMAVDDIIIEAGVGINDVENVNLTLSPNPASNTVKVSANGIEGTVNVAIVDLNGRTIMEQNGNAQSFTFDVTNVARGAYFVRLTGENVNAVRKLIVK